MVPFRMLECSTAMVVAAAAADGGGLWGSQRRNDLARREHISRLFLFRLALQYL